MTKPTGVDYCQYLLSTPINYTLTHFADHSETFSHDQINRYLVQQSSQTQTYLGTSQIRRGSNLRWIHHF